MTIKRATGDTAEVAIVVGSPGCSGSITFPVRLGKDSLDYRGPLDRDTGHQCTMKLTRRGERISTRGDGCSDYHGQTCSFSGTFTLQRR